jgi:predicted transcriptional regulator
LGAATVKEMFAQIPNGTDWSLSTIKTFLGRLVKKNILTPTRVGREFVYAARVSEEEIIQMMTAELLGKICNTKKAQVIESLIVLSELTENDVRRLTARLADKETVTAVHCSCLENASVCTCHHEAPKQAVS